MVLRKARFKPCPPHTHTHICMHEPQGEAAIIKNLGLPDLTRFIAWTVQTRCIKGCCANGNSIGVQEDSAPAQDLAPVCWLEGTMLCPCSLLPQWTVMSGKGKLNIYLSGLLVGDMYENHNWGERVNSEIGSSLSLLRRNPWALMTSANNF